jgi:hypothetical protein
MGEIRLTSKGKVIKRYETPYGSVNIAPHVYQTVQGGKTYCPLDERARIITSSTPRFAKIISHKYARASAREVVDDLRINHGRDTTRSFLQNIADIIGSIAEVTEKDWSDTLPEYTEVVKTVAISLDGTCILMREDGYREAMTGTISLYNSAGERLHTIYLGSAPEYGKATFLARFEREINRIKLQYPKATYIGIADGAKINWEFLEPHTEYQILDFYHATEYLADVAHAVHPMYEDGRKNWLNNACHLLKHDTNAASILLEEMISLSTKRLTQEISTQLKNATTYFQNQKHRMAYDQYRAMNLPIGSGVTEAACKTIVKQRLCQSGMKWKTKGAALVLCLRALVYTKGRWEQFWERINQAGLIGLAEIH